VRYVIQLPDSEAVRSEVNSSLFVLQALKLCRPLIFLASICAGRRISLLTLGQDVQATVIMRLAPYLVLRHETGQVIGNELAFFARVRGSSVGP
jgi:hypothetical protein